MRRHHGLFGFLRSLYHILRGKPQVPPSLEGNELLHAIFNRRSVRCFSQKEIPNDAFAAILEAGRLSPSTVNLQTLSFITFTPSTWQKTFGRAIPFRAQRAVVVLGDVHRDSSVLDAFPHSPLVEYTVAVMNASLAAMNMNLAAEALGISSVMLAETGRTGLLDASYLKERLELPNRVFPLMTIVFGYASGPRPPMPPRLPRDAVCFEQRYHETDISVMEDWLAQMKAGYKASHPLSSFEAQLHVYETKISQAEVNLRNMVFADSNKQSIVPSSKE